ncbi:MAG TPA: hypothetical protein PLQ52_07325 [Lacunisphaera sp.]|jgi:hypothetical protein|nr:hypothetical protein [Lacunisphaera sp.]HQY05860.1 hypothetical protein [Lacunisphaera sp.]
MPTESITTDQIARLSSARDEALRRYTQHLTAVQLKNSRWHAVWSRGRSALRSHVLAGSALPSTNITHAH